MTNQIVINKCELCGEITRLCDSHIIARLVGRRLKKVPKGTLLNLTDPNNPSDDQDLPHRYLYCKSCETIMQHTEDKFARFYDYYNNVINKKRNPTCEFEYNSWLRMMATIHAYRTMKYNYQKLIFQYPFKKNSIDNAIETWRKQILSGDQNGIAPYSHHLFLFNAWYCGKEPGESYPSLEGFLWHNICYGAKQICINTQRHLFTYVILRGMIFLSKLTAESYLDKNTKLLEQGKIYTINKFDDKVTALVEPLYQEYVNRQIVAWEAKQA